MFPSISTFDFDFILGVLMAFWEQLPCSHDCSVSQMFNMLVSSKIVVMILVEIFKYFASFLQFHIKQKKVS